MKTIESVTKYVSKQENLSEEEKGILRDDIFEHPDKLEAIVDQENSTESQKVVLEDSSEEEGLANKDEEPKK